MLALSRRSLQRLVIRDLGRNWLTWIRELRLARAIARLSAGKSVQHAACVAGYATTSGFIDAFRSVYGASPGQIQRRLQS
ncbi:helix-turn-helix domain-containing protein [Rhodovulum sulfidophilum]|uniref:helix-turn-helix domain-containing protein n=1 Tax=Rhodovulum sulfidophilum TaxID=35806 RepID=UPI0030B98405